MMRFFRKKSRPPRNGDDNNNNGGDDRAHSPLRARSLDTLRRAGFRVAPSLPQLDPADTIRPRPEIVRRLASLEAVCMYVTEPPDRLPDALLRDLIARHRLDELMAREELDILALDRGDAAVELANSIGWRMENMVPLAWALGNETPPRIDGEMISGEELEHILTSFAPATAADLDRMLADSTLRPAADILAMADLFYCCHNAVRGAQFSEPGDPPTVPDGFDPITNGGVIHERRHALTWMHSPGVSWDDTDLST